LSSAALRLSWTAAVIAAIRLLLPLSGDENGEPALASPFDINGAPLPRGYVRGPLWRGVRVPPFLWGSTSVITGWQLREAFLSPQMKFYFDRKLAPLASQEVDVRIEELLKYLNMASCWAGEAPVSKEIDDVWHYWILETAEYAQLCQKLYGGAFVHHSSNDYAAYVNPDVTNHNIDLPLGVSILGSYVLNYGPFEPGRVKYWPLAAQLMERLDWDLDQLNDWLGSVLSSAEPEVDNDSVPLPTRRPDEPLRPLWTA
jgi:hypothetical protein